MVLMRSERLLDWGVALMAVMFGLSALRPGDAMTSAGWTELLIIFGSEERIGVITLATGIAHAAAIYINGTAAWTPFARAIMSGLNAIVFIVVASGFAYAAPGGMGAFIYAGLAILSTAVCWRASMRCGEVRAMRRGGLRHGSDR